MAKFLFFKIILELSLIYLTLLNLEEIYVGCYGDFFNGTRDLNGNRITSTSGGRTIGSCISYCCGFNYAGLQNGYV